MKLNEKEISERGVCILTESMQSLNRVQSELKRNYQFKGVLHKQNMFISGCCEANVKLHYALEYLLKLLIIENGIDIPKGGKGHLLYTELWRIIPDDCKNAIRSIIIHAVHTDDTVSFLCDLRKYELISTSIHLSRKVSPVRHAKDFDQRILLSNHRFNVFENIMIMMEKWIKSHNLRYFYDRNDVFSMFNYEVVSRMVHLFRKLLHSEDVVGMVEWDAFDIERKQQ